MKIWHPNIIKSKFIKVFFKMAIYSVIITGVITYNSLAHNYSDTISSHSSISQDSNFENSGDMVIANDDAIITYKMHPFEANVTNNDYGLANGIGSLTITEPPVNGKAAPTENHTIIYTPNRYFIGQDYFEYRICNLDGNCDTAAVFVDILDFDFHPEAVNDTVRIYEESFTTIDVLKNDNYLYDLPITLRITSNLNHGNGMVSQNQIRIEINRYFLGMDSLQYEVCDKDGDCDRAYLFIILVDEDEEGFFIPQGFSPDGDGINDTFTIPEFDHYSEMSISILNRNGIMVFQDNQYNNQWDGISNTGPYRGQLLPSGVYYYIIKIAGFKRDITGYLYLSR